MVAFLLAACPSVKREPLDGPEEGELPRKAGEVARQLAG